MGTSKDWRPVTSGDDWMREQEKRITSEERRPLIQKPSDLLGPGIAPFASPLADWSSQTARFNGFWVADDADNAPDAGVFLGLSIASADGHVTQLAFAHGAVPALWMRQLHTHAGQQPTFTAWGRIFGA